MKTPEEIKQAWDGKQFHQIDNTAYITMEDLGNNPVYSPKELLRQLMSQETDGEEDQPRRTLELYSLGRDIEICDLVGSEVITLDGKRMIIKEFGRLVEAEDGKA